MEQEKKSKKVFIAILIIVIIAAAAVALVLLFTKGDPKKLGSVLTGGQATKIVAKIELQGDLEITKPYQEEWEEIRIYSD